MAAKNTGRQQQQAHSQQALNGKSLIDKNNLRDEDFDKLVIDISNIVSSQSQADEQQSQRPVASDQASNGNSPDSCSPDGGSNHLDGAAVTAAAGSVIAEDTANACGPQRDLHNRLSQPKRPMNAFMVWGRAIRREIHLRFSNVQNALLSKALGRVWRSLDSAAKEPYVRQANLIKAIHRRDYPDYRYQPRRLQERERSKIDKHETLPTITPTVINRTATGRYLSTSQDRDKRQNCQHTTSVAPEAFGAIYPMINGLGASGVGEIVHHRNLKMESDDVGSNRRLQTSNEHEPTGPASQCYADTAFACQDSNHVDSGGHARTDAYYGTSESSWHPKAQYYDGYHVAAQQHQHHHHHRTTLPAKQQPLSSYHYSGPYQHQHQFAYTMQLQQHQQHQNYQPPHHHVLPHLQQQQPMQQQQLEQVDQHQHDVAAIAH